MLRFVLKQGGEQQVPKKLLVKLDLFKKRPDLLREDKYIIESDVERGIFDLFIARFYGAEMNQEVTLDNVGELKILCDELGFHDFDDEIRTLLGHGRSKTEQDVLELTSRVDEHELLLEEIRWHLMRLEQRLDLQSHVSDQIEDVENRLDMTDRLLRGMIQITDVSADVQELKEALSERASVAQLEALAEELSSLKKSEMKPANVESAGSVSRSAPTQMARGNAMPMPFQVGVGSSQPGMAPCPAGVPKKVQMMTFPYNAAIPTDGIISYLTRMCRGNVHKMGVVNVTGSSVWGGWHAHYVADIGNEMSWFHSKNEKDSWICYDFKGNRVRPLGYSIRSYDEGRGYCHPRSWDIECSNDGTTWELCNRILKGDILNGRRVCCHFAMSDHQKFFRFFRLRQTGKNHKGNHSLVICALEIFGVLAIG